MISQTAKCHSQQQDVVFELYARVKQSERENLTRKQHFLLIDLFKATPPYPHAALTGWRNGGLFERQAGQFLGVCGEPKLYWCLCKPVKDPRAAIGWTYAILSIKPISWEHVQHARDDLFKARGMSYAT
ncbi:uncharacterized protein B0I36DRAFT_328189 [Microdochium trichocladiopsis]|uniref:Uncharacterized protein n=1 Tax=Microdochium trichocladiopsis TaxID=1682393 RepID=A0A9P9BLB4_9PEZI|nr:uncharacterized protein B0I36DRAFT_328189 [Microdochium trichocladiopsis]KAH7027907.1 hypothetical protein B0I36DRAFT_328189 [Microdochium trichocladiopsis]